MSTDNRTVSWPGWEVVRTVGTGSFGTVYEIRRELFGRRESAALKVISIPADDSEIAELRREGYDDKSLTEHFRGCLEDIAREYALMIDMKGHSNVVSCDDVRYEQHDDGVGWDALIKMELLKPLPQAIPTVYDEKQVLQLGMDLCSALILCGKRNILHRDIKPQNIFVSRDGDFKLGDFGVAKVAERTTRGTKIGSFQFMSPEVYKNQPYGASADLYSLGLVLYWAMNERRTPFLPLPPRLPRPSEEEQARQRRFSGEPLPNPVNGSEALKQLVRKACAYEPRDRFESPAAMYEALKKLAEGTVDRVRRQPAEIGGIQPQEPVTDDEDRTVGVFRRGFAPVPTPAPEPEQEPIPEPPKPTPPPNPVLPPKPTPPPETKTEPEKKPEGMSSGMKLVLWLVGIVVFFALVIPIYFGTRTGWYNKDGKSYYYESGTAAKGFYTVEGKQYYFDWTGALVTGWFTVSGEKYYCPEGGFIVTGWQMIDGVEYYFDSNGIMATGWQTVNGWDYYFSETGAMAIGWRTIDGEDYYFDEDGRMATGWQEIDGWEYYFDETGALATGMQTDGTDLYYYGANGQPSVGWIYDEVGTYYGVESWGGVLATGKWEIDGTYYYFHENGLMATGRVELETNIVYVFADDGSFLYREVTAFDPTTESSGDDRFELTNYDGETSTSGYRILSEPVYDCTYLHLKEEITTITSGDPDGEWYANIRNLDGQWEYVGSFQVTDGMGEIILSFAEPVSFDAFALTPYDTKAYKGSGIKDIVELRWEETNFGSNINVE